MKTQKTLILVGLAMSLSMVTGCKHSSKSEPIMIDPVVAGGVTPEATQLEIAAQLKERVDMALEGLAESRSVLNEARRSRDNIIEVRDSETNSVMREVLSAEVEGSLKEVEALQQNVEMATRLVIAERTILNAALEGLSAEEQAIIGEAGVEFQMEFNEQKARVEMSLEATRELVRAFETRVQELSERLSLAQTDLANDEAGAGSIPQVVIDERRREVAVLVQDIEVAERGLAVNIASADNLARLYSDMSL